MRVKLALSTLCENPARRTGLSTLFPEFVAHARGAHPEVEWLVFAGGEGGWETPDPGVEVCRKFPSNAFPLRRLVCDHLGVAAEARRRGASALLTVGFHPLRAAGLPVAMHVFSVGAAEGGGRLRSAYRRWALSRGLRRSAVVIANSQWTKDQLGPGVAPVVVSPEGLRQDLFRPEGSRGAAGLEGSYLLWASNLYAYKRLGLVLRAYAGLPRGLRASLPLVVAGGDWAGGRRDAERLSRQLGICENVRFFGWVSDAELPALYRGAHAHVLASSQETFGRSVLESMACGCPSLVQDLPVFREVSADCALYVDYERTALAAQALQRMCEDAGLRQRLSAAGVGRARLFSYERLARERVDAVLGALGVLPT